MKAQNVPRSEFAKRLRELSQRYNTWEVWSDFIVMFAIALSNAVDDQNRPEREEMYRKIVSKYNEKERSIFPYLVADVVTALEQDPEQDFLGQAYMELELGNHWIGQFFTPYDVCRCMAEISVGNAADEIRDKGYITLNDCACGAGATLIAGIHAIRRSLKDEGSPLCWQDHVMVAAQDIDFTTGMMCYIQLSLLGCAGYVKIGNTLTDPMRGGDDLSKYWFTPMYFSSTWRCRRVFHNIDRLFDRRQET